MSRWFQTPGALALRVLEVAASLWTRRWDRAELVRLWARGLWGSGGTVAGAAVIIGGIVGMQGLGYLTRYNASEVFGWAAALSAFRDVGPMLFAVALAARLGTQNTAEVATLAARERLDAACALGLDPTGLVTTPRVLAPVAVALVLYPPASFLIVGVAFLFARALGDQSIAVSAWSALSYSGTAVLWEGLVRLVVFGLLIGLCTTHAGLLVWQGRDHSARAVGAAVQRGSVWALSSVVLVNLLLSLIGGAG
jgi:ABC-type transporter Mla maintaining outer membrane lipid asymmetry permease subunit MlaE